MHPTTNMGLDESLAKVDNIVSCRMIGSLLYRTVSRPEIMLSISPYARFQSNLKETHLTIVKRNFHYLSGTTNLGLCFTRQENFRLQGYYDVNCAIDGIKKKIISGGCHFIGGNLVPWRNKKIGTLVLSTIGVEYILATSWCS